MEWVGQVLNNWNQLILEIRDIFLYHYGGRGWVPPMLLSSAYNGPIREKYIGFGFEGWM